VYASKTTKERFQIATTTIEVMCRIWQIVW